MRRALFVPAVVLILFALPLSAQNRTFVSGVSGLDTNPCTVTQPCRSLATALLATSSGGDLIVLDSAGYGSLVVNKAVNIIVPSGIYGGITRNVAGAGIAVSAGGSDVVRLRGFDFTCSGAGTSGVAITSAARVELEALRINGCSTGIDVTANGARVLMSDITLSGNATALWHRGPNSKVLTGGISNSAFAPSRVVGGNLVLKWDLGYLQTNGFSLAFVPTYYQVEATAGCGSYQFFNIGFTGSSGNYDNRVSPDNTPCSAP